MAPGPKNLKILKYWKENIGKGTKDSRVEFCFTKVTSLSHITSSNTNFGHINSHKSWSNFISRISIKYQLQNLNQSSAFRLNSNFKILIKPSFKISAKIKLHNPNQASAAKYWINFSFKISTELQVQNLDQTLCSKSEQN